MDGFVAHVVVVVRKAVSPGAIVVNSGFWRPVFAWFVVGPSGFPSFILSPRVRRSQQVLLFLAFVDRQGGFVGAFIGRVVGGVFLAIGATVFWAVLSKMVF